MIYVPRTERRSTVHRVAYFALVIALCQYHCHRAQMTAQCAAFGSGNDGIRLNCITVKLGLRKCQRSAAVPADPHPHSTMYIRELGSISASRIV
ncbi:hypothetical protein BD310DRAFT_411242 [Dichomitus squalens]|uniref:Uncharacterized protein n=1 Tax=Dichomitus squalens TaxID=114155 RepID=A0A4Q9PXT8_9APHY|nr:hypothetical protein BD310DRAFT_411242 [Dichomitus squalens]